MSNSVSETFSGISALLASHLRDLHQQELDLSHTLHGLNMLKRDLSLVLDTEMVGFKETLLSSRSMSSDLAATIAEMSEVLLARFILIIDTRLIPIASTSNFSYEYRAH